MYYESDEEDSPLDLSVKKVNHHHHHSLQHPNSFTQADVEEYNHQINLHRPSSRVNYPIHVTNSIAPFTSIFSLFHNGQHPFFVTHNVPSKQHPLQIPHPAIPVQFCSPKREGDQLVHNWPIYNSIDHFSTDNIEDDRREKEDIEVEEEGETDDGDHGSGDSEECRATSISTIRKRITRPLTGRYVKNGTGASPSTLVKLRDMIKEKKRLGPSGPKSFRGYKQRAHSSNSNKKKPLKKRFLPPA